MTWNMTPRPTTAATYFLGTLLVSLSLAGSIAAQAPEPAAEEKPVATTIGDPEIPDEDLDLLVKPLTKEELVVEADGWRDLLKANVQEIAALRILVRQKKQTEQEGDEPPAETEGAESTENLVEALPELQEKKAHLVERLNVVLDELEAKGGDVTAYRQYISALTGVAVEVTDATTFWTVVKGWFKSEQGGQRWGWNLLKFVTILIAFYFGASIVSTLVRHGIARIQGASQLLVNFLGRFIKQVLMIIGFIVGLAALEVNIAPLLAAVGAAGFVVAFALQDTLSNFASGMLILAYRPFDVGDVIEAAGVSGVVDSVSLFSTHVRTFDNKLMIIPNNDIWGGTITNATASDTRRVDMVFGIGYQDDLEQATTILQELVKSHPLILSDPAATVQVNELGDSAVNFVVRPWVKTGDYWTVYWDVTRGVKEAFDRHGISIPFPQRDVHIFQEKSLST